MDTGKEICKVQFIDPNVPFEEIPLIVAILPSIVLFVILNILKQPVYIASFIAIVVGIVLYWKRLGMLPDGHSRKSGYIGEGKYGVH